MMHKASPFFTSLLTLVISFLSFDNSHSKRCEVISRCGFDLHFPDDWWYWTSFHVSLGHLYDFIGKIYFEVFFPFSLFYVELYELLIYFGYQPLLDMIWKYFSHSAGGLFLLLLFSLLCSCSLAFNIIIMHLICGVQFTITDCLHCSFLLYVTHLSQSDVTWAF